MARKQRSAGGRRGVRHGTGVPLPAKLLPPASGGAIARPRLFRALDRLTRQPVTWIHAPAGAGKTTLLTTYLRARRRKVLWYDVDAGDADVNGFHHYARLGAEALVDASLPLPKPVLGPAPPQTIFTRRFFEALFAHLPAGTILVFDNYQAAAGESTWNDAFRELIAALTSRVRVIVASRLAPPAALARLAASGDLQILDWSSLRLDENEARAMLQRHTGRGGSTIVDHATLMASIDGWPVIVALLARSRATPPALSPGVGARQPIDEFEAVFQFLASEILDQLPEPERALLQSVALFPSFSIEMARELTAHPETPARLAKLYGEHLLLERHGEADFRLHDLFRAFLLRRGARDHGHDVWKALSVRAAQLLARRDQFPAAAELLAETGSWSALADLIECAAPDLGSQGRLATLAQALRQLPTEIRHERPWLLHWEAVCALGRPDQDAALMAERSFLAFRSRNDEAGMLLSWSLVVQAITIAGQDFHPLAHWIEILDELAIPPPTPAVAVRLAHSKTLAAFFWDPGSTRSIATADWAVDIVRRMGAAEDRILVGGAAAFLYHTDGAARRAEEVRAMTQRESGLRPQVPAVAIPHAHFEALVEFQRANFTVAGDAVERGLAAARASGLHAWDAQFFAMQAFTAIVRGELDDAERHLQSVDVHPSSATPLGRGAADFVRGWLAFERGDIVRAIRANSESIATGERLGFVLGQVQSLIADVVYRATLGDAEATRRSLDVMTARRTKVSPSFLAVPAGLAEVYAGLCLGQAPIDELRAALAKARDGGFILPSPLVMHRLVSAALEHDIEPDLARRLLVAYNLRPTPATAAIAAWPWPVRIRLLGPLRIEVEGRPVQFGRKLPSMPLALLKILVAANEPSTPARLTRALWPGYGEDAPRGTLDTTLYRLRKLLGTDAAIESHEGRIGLAGSVCWSDLRAFALTCDRIETLNRDGLPTPASLDRCERTLLDLYRGPLGLEDDPAPVARIRGEVRRRFARAALELGKLWAQLGQPERREQVMKAAAQRDAQAFISRLADPPASVLANR
jgi:LuxR family maltose regulon positive regulatory protein